MKNTKKMYLQTNVNKEYKRCKREYNKYLQQLGQKKSIFDIIYYFTFFLLLIACISFSVMALIYLFNNEMTKGILYFCGYGFSLCALILGKGLREYDNEFNKDRRKDDYFCNDDIIGEINKLVSPHKTDKNQEHSDDQGGLQ